MKFLLLLILLLNNTIENKIRTIEHQIASSPIEIAVFIDADTGEETARVIGTRYGISDSFLSVWYTANPGADRLKEIAAYHDKIITHNHPDGDMMPSAADVWGAALLNAHEMRVTGIEHGVQITCVLGRGKLLYWPNYPYTKADRDTWNNKASPAFFRSLGYSYSCFTTRITP